MYLSNGTELGNIRISLIEVSFTSYVLRLLAKLSLSVNPNEALLHAETATSLGDISSPALEAFILDYYNCGSSTGVVGTDRLGTISQLILKLDPAFAFKVNCLQNNQKRFITFIFGELN